MNFRETQKDLDIQLENLHRNFFDSSPIIDLELLPLETGVENSGLIF